MHSMIYHWVQCHLTLATPPTEQLISHLLVPPRVSRYQICNAHIIYST